MTTPQIPRIYTFGYTVYASVDGKKTPQPISQRFSVREAAEEYAELAKKNGYVDSYVHEVTGFEKEPIKRTKTEMRPRSQ